MYMKVIKMQCKVGNAFEKLNNVTKKNGELEATVQHISDDMES